MQIIKARSFVKKKGQLCVNLNLFNSNELRMRSTYNFMTIYDWLLSLHECIQNLNTKLDFALKYLT